MTKEEQAVIDAAKKHIRCRINRSFGELEEACDALTKKEAEWTWRLDGVGDFEVCKNGMTDIWLCADFGYTEQDAIDFCAWRNGEKVLVDKAKADAFDIHVKTVGAFLAELYAVMVDPLEEPANIEETKRRLLIAAETHREILHAMQGSPNVPAEPRGVQGEPRFVRDGNVIRDTTHDLTVAFCAEAVTIDGDLDRFIAMLNKEYGPGGK